jgi:hypothetical protein
MKYLMTVFILTLSVCAFSQVFPIELETSWDFKDEAQKVIIVTYDLEDLEDLRYLKIVAKAYVDDRLIPMRSLRGDIGEAVKVGKNKTIEWSWENDVVEIAGELRFVVTADNPTAVEEVAISDTPEPIKPEIPLIKLLSLPLAAGGGLVLTGLISSGGAKSDWNALTGSERTQEQYDELNKKHKTGQWIAIGGTAIIAAGIIWYFKEKANINSYSSRVTVEPGIGELTFITPFETTNYASMGMSLNYKF